MKRINDYQSQNKRQPHNFRGAPHHHNQQPRFNNRYNVGGGGSSTNIGGFNDSTADPRPSGAAPGPSASYSFSSQVNAVPFGHNQTTPQRPQLFNAIKPIASVQPLMSKVISHPYANDIPIHRTVQPPLPLQPQPFISVPPPPPPPLPPPSVPELQLQQHQKHQKQMQQQLQQPPPPLHSQPSPLHSQPPPLHTQPPPLHSQPPPLHSQPPPQMPSTSQYAHLMKDKRLEVAIHDPIFREIFVNMHQSEEYNLMSKPPPPLPSSALSPTSHSYPARNRETPRSQRNQNNRFWQQPQLQHQQPPPPNGRSRSNVTNKRNPFEANAQANPPADAASADSTEMATDSGDNSQPSTSKAAAKKLSKQRNQASANASVNAGSDGSVVHDISVGKKSKRKPMSTHYTTKQWNAEDAELAMQAEQEISCVQKLPMLMIRFPDPEVSKELIKGFSPLIEHVHFQQPSAPRYCFVQLKEDSDVEQVKAQLCEIPFGAGKITAELKNNHSRGSGDVTPKDIDPYVLYIGNLPSNVNVRRVKEFFPDSARIDIGYAQRMKYTRYAFVRFNSVAEAIAGYRSAFSMDLGPRSLVIRFRRLRGNIGLHDPPLLPADVDTDAWETSKAKKQKISADEADEEKPKVVPALNGDAMTESSETTETAPMAPQNESPEAAKSQYAVAPKTEPAGTADTESAETAETESTATDKPSGVLSPTVIEILDDVGDEIPESVTDDVVDEIPESNTAPGHLLPITRFIKTEEDSEFFKDFFKDMRKNDDGVLTKHPDDEDSHSDKPVEDDDNASEKDTDVPYWQRELTERREIKTERETTPPDVKPIITGPPTPFGTETKYKIPISAKPSHSSEEDDINDLFDALNPE